MVNFEPEDPVAAAARLLRVFLMVTAVSVVGLGLGAVTGSETVGALLAVLSWLGLLVGLIGLFWWGVVWLLRRSRAKNSRGQ